MGITDYLGGRGEAIAFARLTKICREDADRPYFWPHFLGEKCETFDFLVELIDAGETTPFYFVQVKTTRKEFTKSQTPPRLRGEVSKKDIRRMVAYQGLRIDFAWNLWAFSEKSAVRPPGLACKRC